MFNSAIIYCFELTQWWSRLSAFGAFKHIETKIYQTIPNGSTCSSEEIKCQITYFFQLAPNYLRYLPLFGAASENKMLVSPRDWTTSINLSLLSHEKIEIPIFTSKHSWWNIDFWVKLIEDKYLCTRKRCSCSGHRCCRRSYWSSCKRYSRSWTGILGTRATFWTIRLTWTLQ